MNERQRSRAIENFGVFQLSEVAKVLLDGLIQAWEEAIGNDDGLEHEINQLADDKEFINYIHSRRSWKQTRGIELIHTLQDLRFIVRLSKRYPVLSRIHLDRD